jgi:hypothetical protein
MIRQTEQSAIKIRERKCSQSKYVIDDQFILEIMVANWTADSYHVIITFIVNDGIDYHCLLHGLDKIREFLREVAEFVKHAHK